MYKTTKKKTLCFTSGRTFQIGSISQDFFSGDKNYPKYHENFQKSNHFFVKKILKNFQTHFQKFSAKINRFGQKWLILHEFRKKIPKCKIWINQASKYFFFLSNVTFFLSLSPSKQDASQEVVETCRNGKY